MTRLESKLDKYYEVGRLRGDTIVQAHDALWEHIAELRDFGHDVPDGVQTVYLKLESIIKNEIR